MIGKDFYIRAILGICITLSAHKARSQWMEVLNGGGVTTGLQTVTIAVSQTGKLLVGTYRGIYSSTNNGESWVPSNKGLTDGRVNSFAVNGNSIFVAMNSGGGVLRSTDDGASWFKVNNGLSIFAIVKLATANGIVFGLDNQGTLFYSDNGDLWSQMSNSPSSGNSLGSNDSTLFIGSSNGLYRSTNAGASWDLLSTGSANPNVIGLSVYGNTVIVSTYDGSFLSIDNGLSWHSVGLPSGYPNVVQKGSTILTSYYTGFMSRSTDNGFSWAIVPNVPATGSMIIAGGYFVACTVQGVYISKDDGLSWSPFNIGLTDAHPSLSTFGSSIITTNGTVVKISQDMGATWALQNVDSSSLHTSVLADNGEYYVSNRADVWSLPVNGSNWVSIPALGAEKILASGEGNVYAVDEDYLFRLPMNDQWTEVSSVVRWVSSFAANGNKVFAGSIFSGDTFTGVFVSLDSGVTWKQVNNTLPQINAMAYDGQLLICGTSSGIYISKDDGVTWQISAFEGININSVIFNNGRIFAAHREIEVSNDSGASWQTITGEVSASLGSYHEITTLAIAGTKLVAATSTGSVWTLCMNPPTPSITGAWSHYPTVLTSSSPANNQWFLNGQPISGATGQNLDVATDGDYSVVVTEDGCSSKASPVYTITACTIPPTPTITVSGTITQTTLISSAMEGNQWFKDGTSVPGATDQTFTPISSGNYSVQVTIDGCQSGISSTLPVVITAVAQDLHTDIVLYPNPVKDELILSSQAWSKLNTARIRIVDPLGKTLLEEFTNDSSFSILATSLPPGIYILEVNQSGDVIRKRFVKE